MFKTFTLLSMQTEQDKDYMLKIGIKKNCLTTLGNLKYDLTANPASHKNGSLIHDVEYIRIPERPCIVAGSTHEGEEQYLFTAFQHLKENNIDVQLIIAPRNISRAEKILNLAQSHSCRAALRTSKPQHKVDILILDTLGELLEAFSIADIAFVGGSLVNQGGHNPIEPASYGIPVVFGNHMEDFKEVSCDLVRARAAIQINTPELLTETLRLLILNTEKQRTYGEAAKLFINNQHGVAKNHVAIIDTLL